MKSLTALQFSLPSSSFHACNLSIPYHRRSPCNYWRPQLLLYLFLGQPGNVAHCSALRESLHVSDPSSVYCRGNASDEKVVDEVSDKEEQAVTLQCFNHADYKWAEVWVHIPQICAVAHTIPDVELKHKDALYQYDHGFDYSKSTKSTMTVTFVPSGCTLYTFEDMTEKEGVRLVLRKGGALGIVNGCFCLEYLLDSYRQAKADKGWAQERTWVFFYQYHDGATLFHCEIIMLSWPKKKVTTIIICDLQFIDLISRVLKYVQTFELEYNVPSLQTRVRDIDRDMYRSDLLFGESDFTCLHYACVAKLLIKNPNIYELVPAQSGNGSDQAALCVIHLNNRTMYGADGSDAMLFVSAAEFNLKSSFRSLTFSCNTSCIRTSISTSSPSTLRPHQKHLHQQSWRTAAAQSIYGLWHGTYESYSHSSVADVSVHNAFILSWPQRPKGLRRRLCTAATSAPWSTWKSISFPILPKQDLFSLLLGCKTPFTHSAGVPWSPNCHSGWEWWGQKGAALETDSPVWCQSTCPKSDLHLRLLRYDTAEFVASQDPTPQRVLRRFRLWRGSSDVKEPSRLLDETVPGVRPVRIEKHPPHIEETDILRCVCNAWLPADVPSWTAEDDFKNVASFWKKR